MYCLSRRWPCFQVMWVIATLDLYLSIIIYFIVSYILLISLAGMKDASTSDSEKSESEDDDTSEVNSNFSADTTSPVSVGTKRKQPDDAKGMKHAKVSRTYSINFAEVLHKLYELLQSIEAKNIMLVLTQLLASNSNRIQLFTQKELLECNNCSNVSGILKQLRHCWTWYDHALLRVLIEACKLPEALKLLDDFHSSFDISQPLSAYSIPDVSSSLAVYDHSSYTVLATKHQEDYSTLLLQDVNRLKLSLSETFDVTEHCIQLVAVHSSPTVLFWMVPKCVVPVICAKVQEHCSFLNAQKISEVAIYPNTMFVTDGSIQVGLLAYLSDKIADVSHMHTYVCI